MQVLNLPAADEPLPCRDFDHPLTGEWRERRIGADLAVIDHTPDDTDFELVRIRHADRPSLPLLQGQIGLRQIGNLPCFTAASIPVDPRVAERHEP
jgi:hypothetical protein